MACHGCAYTLTDFAVLTADTARLRDFLVLHHVIACVYFCDECHQECRVDDRRQLFRCDRQETVKLQLHRGVPRSPKDTHSQKARQLVRGLTGRNVPKKLYVGFAHSVWLFPIPELFTVNRSCLGKVWWIGVLFVARFVS